MPTPEQIEAAMASLREFRAVEDAIKRIDYAIQHEARVWNVQAEDDAQSERSIGLLLTKEESKTVFQTMGKVLASRLAALEREMKG